MHLPGGQYAKLMEMPTARDKISSVLDMICSQNYDLPMICKYRRFEFAECLDEQAVWLVWTLHQEYGKFLK